MENEMENIDIRKVNKKSAKKSKTTTSLKNIVVKRKG